MALSSGGSSNYNLSFDTTKTFAITGTFGLSVTGALANDKTYDSTTAATVNFSGASLSGVQSGLTNVSLNTSGYTATFSQSNVGAGLTVTVSGLALSGADASDYTLTQPTLTATISARPITITAAANSKIYDGTTSAAAVPTITSGTLVGTNSISVSETYGTKNVGTGLTMTPTGSVSDGNGGANYAVTFATSANGTSMRGPLRSPPRPIPRPMTAGRPLRRRRASFRAPSRPAIRRISPRPMPARMPAPA